MSILFKKTITHPRSDYKITELSLKNQQGQPRGPDMCHMTFLAASCLPTFGQHNALTKQLPQKCC